MSDRPYLVPVVLLCCDRPKQRTRTSAIVFWLHQKTKEEPQVLVSGLILTHHKKASPAKHWERNLGLINNDS